MGGTQQLTNWMKFHGSMLAILIKPRRYTATHILDEISYQHVSNLNEAQEPHSNSLPGRISWWHVSNSNGPQKAHSNPPTE